ncbi:hypothetical protein CS022_14300 [Veronia nyctiphanis]|uniref:Uncharacterized protein n=1 Tax=Veronia nyctiphanis TaxID=1278244 RepID=A0A4V1LSR5_9GAMM|nr:hypothetical protein [Veronia nyctiphanis]RXJ72618.1 hypothetical protein CS022_14300 [Veronia nyctiphanis]
MKWLLLFIGIVVAPLASAEAPVLVIHSYHHGFEWSNQVNKGLEETLEGLDIPIQETYLDVKRNYSSAYRDQLKTLYRYRLAEHKYRAILTVDDAALELVNELADAIGQTPVIFSGLNQYSRERFSNIPRLTGVGELISLPDNLKLMSSLHPDAKRVHLVFDSTATSLSYWRMFREQQEKEGEQL